MLRIRLLALVLVALVTASASPASAGDLCLKLSTNEQIILKGFSLKRGKSFDVGGYANLVGMAGVVQFPVSGRAIASSNGEILSLGLTKYFAELAHDFGSSNVFGSVAAASVTYSLTLVANPGSTVGTGTSGLGAVLTTSVLNGITEQDPSVQIIACGKKDNGLTLP